MAKLTEATKIIKEEGFGLAVCKTVGPNWSNRAGQINELIDRFPQEEEQGYEKKDVRKLEESSPILNYSIIEHKMV